MTGIQINNFYFQALRDLHNEILNVEQQNNKRRISYAVLRGNPDTVFRSADETGDSIAEHSDDESMTNAPGSPDTPDVGNVSTLTWHTLCNIAYVQNFRVLLAQDGPLTLES